MTETVLGVETSLSGKRWRARLDDARLGLALAQRLDAPEIVGRVLAARGVGIDDAEAFLAPSLRTMLPDPSHLLDMDRAVERLATALERDEPIAIFGDYDVDGATSTAVLKRYLDAVGARTLFYIPDRMAEGYGPNTPAMLSLKEQGARVVVTVDCGTSAFEPLAAAKEAGLDVVVVDHHIAEARLPRHLQSSIPTVSTRPAPTASLRRWGLPSCFWSASTVICERRNGSSARACPRRT